MITNKSIKIANLIEELTKMWHFFNGFLSNPSWKKLLWSQDVKSGSRKPRCVFLTEQTPPEDARWCLTSTHGRRSAAGRDVWWWIQNTCSKTKVKRFPADEICRDPTPPNRGLKQFQVQVCETIQVRWVELTGCVWDGSRRMRCSSTGRNGNTGLPDKHRNTYN